MKYLTGLCLLLIVLASCHKTKDGGLRQQLELSEQQWRLSEWDVMGGGIARSYPGPDTTIVLNLDPNGSYTVQINGQPYSNGSFRLSEATASGINEPEIIFSNTLQLKPGLGIVADDTYSISGGTLTLRSALLNPGLSFSIIFQPVHL